MANGGDLEEPVRILSDLHLGHPGSRVASVAQLRPLLKGARTVILNGDTAEMRSPRYLERGTKMTGELRALLDEMGVATVIITGNHDPEISDLHHLDLCGGKVLVTHGEVLFPEIAPWGIRNRAEREKILDFDRKLREEHDGPDDLEARLRRAKRVCEFTAIFEPDVERGWWGHFRTVTSLFDPPTKLLTVFHVWWDQKRLADEFCEACRPEARILIFGHTHREGVWRRRDRTLINTGGFISVGKAQVVEIEGGELRVWPVRDEGGEFRLGRKPRAVLKAG